MAKISKDNIYYDAQESYRIDKRDTWKLQLIRMYAHKKGLDIGCGSGRWLKNFPGWQGIDTDARAKATPGVKLGSVEDIPFEKNSFDIVLTSHILEHVTREHFEKAMAEINRVLKKNGILVVFGPNPSHQNFYNDYTHVNPVNVFSLSSVLKHTGFEILEADFSLYRRLWLGKLLPRFLLNPLAPLLLSEYYVVARKKV